MYNSFVDFNKSSGNLMHQGQWQVLGPGR